MELLKLATNALGFVIKWIGMILAGIGNWLGISKWTAFFVAISIIIALIYKNR